MIAILFFILNLCDRLMDLLLPTGLEVSEKEEQAATNLARWLSGELKGRDQVQIDTSRAYLLLAAGGKLHLVSRKTKWRAVLDAPALTMYQARGRWAFRKMRRHLDRHDRQR